MGSGRINHQCVCSMYWNDSGSTRDEVGLLGDWHDWASCQSSKMDVRARGKSYIERFRIHFVTCGNQSLFQRLFYFVLVSRHDNQRHCGTSWLSLPFFLYHDGCAILLCLSIFHTWILLRRALEISIRCIVGYLNGKEHRLLTFRLSIAGVLILSKME